MTPRQIIQQISERRHLHNITAKKDYFADKKYHNVCGNTSRLVNKSTHGANNEIKQSKLEEFLDQRIEEPTIPCQWVEPSMYPMLGDYLQGNAILTKTRQVGSPTRFYDCNKERENKTSDASITTSLYTTIKSTSEGNGRPKNQRMDAVSKAKAGRVTRDDSWPESAYFHSGLSDIRGMAKKIHDKSIVMGNIITVSEMQRLETERQIVNGKCVRNAKHFEEQSEKVTNKGTGKPGGQESTKRIRVHIYVPTAEMNS